MKTLFDSRFTTDDTELESLLAAAQVKAFLNNLWDEYSPLVIQKKKFVGGLKAQPFTRIWEMYLGCSLRECGLNLDPKGEAGPDIKLSNPTVWVEAVASTDGHSQDTQPASRTPKVLLPIIGGPPEDEIIRRCAFSIDRKKTDFDGYLKNGTVSPADPCVIALNVYKTSFSQYDHQHTPQHIPLIVRVLFGYGKAVYFNSTNEYSGCVRHVRPDYEYRASLNGSDPTDIFFRKEYSGISALLLSKEGFCRWQERIPESLSENLTVIRNPLATNRLSEKWLKSGHEIWIARGQLHKRVCKNGTEQLLESFPLPYNLPAEIRAKLP